MEQRSSTPPPVLEREENGMDYYKTNFSGQLKLPILQRSFDEEEVPEVGRKKEAQIDSPWQVNSEQLINIDEDRDNISSDAEAITPNSEESKNELQPRHPETNLERISSLRQRNRAIDYNEDNTPKYDEVVGEPVNKKRAVVDKPIKDNSAFSESQPAQNVPAPNKQQFQYVIKDNSSFYGLQPVQNVPVPSTQQFQYVINDNSSFYELQPVQNVPIPSTQQFQYVVNDNSSFYELQPVQNVPIHSTQQFQYVVKDNSSFYELQPAQNVPAAQNNSNINFNTIPIYSSNIPSTQQFQYVTKDNSSLYELPTQSVPAPSTQQVQYVFPQWNFIPLSVTLDATIIEYYRCGVCHAIAEWNLILSCNHLFCGTCLTGEETTCPQCSARIRSARHDLIIEKLIPNLRLRAPTTKPRPENPFRHRKIPRFARFSLYANFYSAYDPLK